jgi:ATP-dependent Lon protease
MPEEVRPPSKAAAPGEAARPGALPDGSQPVVFLVSAVLFPGGTAQAQLRTKRNLDQVAAWTDPDHQFVFAFAPGLDPDKVETKDLAPVGVVGRVVSRIRLPDGSLQVAMQGLRRVRLGNWVGTDPVLLAEVAPAVEVPAPRAAAERIILRILELAEQLVRMDDAYTPELVRLLQSNLDDPGRFADLVALTVAMDLRQRMAVLVELSVEKRLDTVADMLAEKVEIARIAREIEARARGDISKAQREYYLRQQLKAIRAELGEESREEADARRFVERADAAKLPDEPDRVVRGEIERLRVTSAQSAEYAVILNYLDWVLALPWSKESEDRLDLKEVQRTLDADHYGLEKPKRRILEYLSVRALAPAAPGPVLCFAGPPGTGKTSLAHSIARAMGRCLARISVGGVHDESPIRGHRRTYVGAMPGRFLQALRRCGSRNPVLVVDEIDKMQAGPQGDPAAALLEVLDPEQNGSFTDHYLDMAFDLSHCFFVATANNLANVPGPLLDRMEVVELHGYTEAEKVEIAYRHLVPKALASTGTKGRVRFGRPVLRGLARSYTLEAGVRDLGRRVEEVCRKYAVRLAGGEKGPFAPTEEDLPKLVGRPSMHADERRRVPEVGVATGLAWTPYGGDLLVIEGIRMPGAGGFALTGSLGDVMKESVQAASSWVRAHAADLGIDLAVFGQGDVHIHFPEGAVPKDGPSAGVAVAVVLASLFTGRPVRHDIAMTGEVTLRGKVLPVGGIREKVSAAVRGGIQEVMLPAANLPDAEELPKEIRGAIKLHGVATLADAIRFALGPPGGAKGAPRKAPPAKPRKAARGPRGPR